MLHSSHFRRRLLLLSVLVHKSLTLSRFDVSWNSACFDYSCSLVVSCFVCPLNEKHCSEKSPTTTSACRWARSDDFALTSNLDLRFCAVHRPLLAWLAPMKIARASGDAEVVFDDD